MVHFLLTIKIEGLLKIEDVPLYQTDIRTSVGQRIYCKRLLNERQQRIYIARNGYAQRQIIMSVATPSDFLLLTLTQSLSEDFGFYLKATKTSQLLSSKIQKEKRRDFVRQQQNCSHNNNNNKNRKQYKNKNENERWGWGESESIRGCRLCMYTNTTDGGVCLNFRKRRRSRPIQNTDTYTSSRFIEKKTPNFKSSLRVLSLSLSSSLRLITTQSNLNKP